MKRRQWDATTKVKIVLEGLSGKPVSEICNGRLSSRLRRGLVLHTRCSGDGLFRRNETPATGRGLTADWLKKAESPMPEWKAKGRH